MEWLQLPVTPASTGNLMPSGRSFYLDISSNERQHTFLNVKSMLIWPPKSVALEFSLSLSMDVNIFLHWRSRNNYLILIHNVEE